MTDKSEIFDDDELAAIADSRESYQERRERQQDFLDTVSDESDTEVLETPCELADGHTVTVKAKLQGELIDKLGHVQERLESAEGDSRMYKVSDAADDASQLLDDVIVETAYDKDTFYTVYESEGLEALGEMLNKAFGALTDEQDRQSGAADGFRGQ